MSGRRFGKWQLLLTIVVVLVAFDQWSKFLVVERLTTAFERNGAVTLGQKIAGFYSYRNLERLAKPPYPVVKAVWRMNYVENPGAVWGVFRQIPQSVRYPFFILVTIAALIFVAVYYRRLREDQRLLQIALSLVMAGAIGNFIDRLARVYVIDFIEWYWWNRPDIRWPTFNVADSLIVVGVVLLIFFPDKKAKRDKALAGKAAGLDA
jgi:signal peptidase II